MMLAIEVYMNGRKVTVAGAEDLGVLTAIVTACGKLGSRSIQKNGAPRKPDLSLYVGGLTSRRLPLEDEHLNWVSAKTLSVGDKIEFRLVKTATARKHRKATPAGGNMSAKRSSGRNR